MAGAMAQWHEHLTGAQRCLRHVLTHNCIPAGKFPFVPQSLENPMRGVPLLLVNAAVTFKDGVDPRHVRPKLLRSRPFTSPVTGRNRKLKHLCDRVPVNAKLLRCLTAAHPVHHHRSSDLGIEFHCEHPSSPSMPFNGMETA